jgi:large subunit ribosomal protein L13
MPGFAPILGSPAPPVPGGLGRILNAREYMHGRRRAPHKSSGPRPNRPHPVWLSWSAALKTYVATPQDRERNWLLVDAEGQTLGRLATQIADALRGKRKPTYTPHVDVGDFVVVVNAEKIAVTGQKRHEKLYHRHSGYPGGLKTRTLNDMLERRPEEVIRLAVRGMLPRNRLARKQLTKLKVYAGPDHPHEAQKPQPMEIST